VFNVGGGARISLNRALEILAGVAGRPLDVRPAERESGDVQDTGADISRARAQLGYEPSTSVEEGLAAEFAWVREQGLRRPAAARAAACPA
jgi:UDP-glucose 4-epimerase